MYRESSIQETIQDAGKAMQNADRIPEVTIVINHAS